MNETAIASEAPPALTACPHDAQVSCANCWLNALCLPVSLHAGELSRLERIIERNHPFKKGDHLYRQGDSFRSVYAVRSGSFKSYLVHENGEGRVTGFHLPGEIIGMGGIAASHYGNSTVALEHASVCEIPFSKLEDLSQAIPSLQHRFFLIMGDQIAKDQQIQTLLSSFTAEERAVSFLLGLSTRYARASLSRSRFMLPMTRSDIGQFLGLTVETMSRILTALQRKGLISVRNREIELLDIGALRGLAGNAS